MGVLYVVQGFENIDGNVVASKPILHGLADLAMSRAERLAEHAHGVLVYSQLADTDRDQYSTPRILFQHGQVPDPERHSLRETG